MNKKAQTGLIVGIIIAAVVIAGAIIYIFSFNNGITGNVVNENQQKEITCDSPYIKVGNECCLDQNSNRICDRDENTIQNLQQEESKKECYLVTWGSFSTACYDYRGLEPYISTAYCDSDVEVYEDYICKNNLCEKSIRRQDCSKDLKNVKGWTCMESNNPPRDGWIVTCTPK